MSVRKLEQPSIYVSCSEDLRQDSPKLFQDRTTQILAKPKWTIRVRKFLGRLIHGRISPETGIKQMERFVLTVQELAKTQRYIILYEDKLTISAHLCDWRWMSNPDWRKRVLLELAALGWVSDPKFDPPDEQGRWTFFAQSAWAVPKVSTLPLTAYTPED
jgi:hypothetical protein